MLTTTCRTLALEHDATVTMLDSYYSVLTVGFKASHLLMKTFLKEQFKAIIKSPKIP